MPEGVCGLCEGGSEGLQRGVTAGKCVFGFSCRFGRGCRGWHSAEQEEHFDERDRVRQRELTAPCGFCEQGICRYGRKCRRGRGDGNGK